MNISYFLNIPANSPATDFNNMKTNTNSINSLIGIDHVSFGTDNGGYHSQVHMVANQVSPSINVGTAGVLYANTGTAISQLFYNNGTTNYQLWSGASSQAQNGYIKIGNIMIQWGFVSSTSSSNIVTMPTSFSSTGYNVITSGYSTFASAPVDAITYAVTAIGTNTFNWTAITKSANWGGFYWTAIGPTT